MSAGPLERLLVVSGYWPTAGNPVSGVFVVQQAAAFVRAGYAVDVIVPVTVGRRRFPLCRPQDLGLPPESTRLAEAAYVRLPEKLSSLPGALRMNTASCGRALRKACASLASQGSWHGCLVHGVRYAGVSLPAWRREVRAPTALVIHGVEPFLERSANRERATPLVAKAVLDCERVVLVGESLRPHASGLGVPNGAIEVVGNGTDVPPLPAGGYRQQPVSEVRRIVSVSNLIETKGIDLNLRALARLRERDVALRWEYRVIGDGPCRERLQSLSRSLGIDGCVHFLGRLRYAETMHEVSDCDIFTLPSWQEAFGIVYLEAMARGRPVIGCTGSGPAKFVEDGNNGLLVRPQSVEDLTEALGSLLRDPQLCIDLGRRARLTAEGNTWDANARRMLSLLEGSFRNRAQ